MPGRWCGPSTSTAADGHTELRWTAAWNAHTSLYDLVEWRASPTSAVRICGYCAGSFEADGVCKSLLLDLQTAELFFTTDSDADSLCRKIATSDLPADVLARWPHDQKTGEPGRALGWPALQRVAGRRAEQYISMSAPHWSELELTLFDMKAAA